MTVRIEPTLTDREVLDFCRNGFLIVPGVVRDDTNRWVTEFLAGHSGPEPNEILHEERFVNEVLLNPAAAGAVRSLLGDRFELPVLMSNHRTVGPKPVIGGWHRDGGAVSGPECNYLQVFYYPQEVTLEMGPTALLPGSHLVYHESTQMGHFGQFAHQVLTVAPAGTLFITSFAIWHRATAKTATATRNLMKYNYWRTVPPQRDWIVDPGFDFATEPYREYYKGGSPIPVSSEPTWSAVEMFFWLCGQPFRTIGGQGWPLDSHIGVDKTAIRKLVYKLNPQLKEMQNVK